MAYPTTAYRGGQRTAARQAALPGFQRPALPTSPRPLSIPVPANDPIVPANDRFKPLSAETNRTLRTLGKKLATASSASAGGPERFKFPFPVASGLALGISRVNTAREIYDLVKPKHYTIIPPSGYSQFAGDFAYPYPYNGAPSHRRIDYNEALTGQALGPNDWVGSPERFGMWIQNDVNAPHYAHHSSYGRQPGSVTEGIETTVVIDNFPGISEVPSTIAVPRPGVEPQPTPYWAIPYRVASPEVPGIGRHEGQPTRPDPIGDRATDLASEEMAVTVILNPTNPGQNISIVAPPVRKPPGPNVKERKVIANVGAKALAALVTNLVTETADAIDALYDALPEDKKIPKGKPMKRWHPKYGKYWQPNPAQKAAKLYENFGDIDVKEAVANLVKNEVQDQVIGRVNAKATKNYRGFYDKSGRFVGFGTGPAL